MKHWRFFLLLFILQTGLLRKGYTQLLPEWVSNYGSNFYTCGQNSMAINSQGDVFISGYEMVTYVLSNILKYNPDGSLAWSTVYDSTWYLNKLIIDDQSNIYLACTNNQIVGENTLVKYDSSGTLLWERIYITNYSGNSLHDIKFDHSGNILIGGVCRTPNSSILKYDPNGNLLWVASDTTLQGNNSSFIAIDDSNNIYHCCPAYDSLVHVKIFKYNVDGIKVWEKIYRGNYNPGGAKPYGIIYKNGFLYTIAGTRDLNGSGDLAVLKYDTAGTLQWETIYNTPNLYDTPYDIDVDDSNRVYVCGKVENTSCSDSMCLISIDRYGSIVWQKSYSSGICAVHIPYDITIDSQGYIYLIGETPDSSYQASYTTIKYDSLGNVLFTSLYVNPAMNRDIPKSIVVDSIGNIYISGISIDSASRSIQTLKYSFLVNHSEIKNESCETNLYPNPFTNTIFLSPGCNLVNSRFHLYDLLMRKILSIDVIDSYISIPEISSGIYVYQIEQRGNILSSGKIIRNHK
jgi:hypothetical protein